MGWQKLSPTLLLRYLPVTRLIIIPAAIGILSIIIVLLYPLNETRMKQIEMDLKARRAGAAAPAVGAA